MNKSKKAKFRANHNFVFFLEIFNFFREFFLQKKCERTWSFQQKKNFAKNVKLSPNDFPFSLKNLIWYKRLWTWLDNFIITGLFWTCLNCSGWITYSGTFRQIQWEPEHTGICRLRLDSIYEYKYSNEQETQQLCSVNRRILLNK